MSPEPGIYTGISFAEYAEWDAINNSTLWVLRMKSPLHAKTYMEEGFRTTPALHIGKALDTLLLDTREFNNHYLVAPKINKRTDKGKELWAAFIESANGKEILTQEEYEKIDIMGKAIKKQVIHRLIQTGEAQVCIVWIDKKTGILCKARLDYLHRERAIIIDLKSTMDASPGSFSRSIYKFGYFQQCAFYADGWETLTGDEPAFTWLPIEKTPPFAVAAYEAHENIIKAGRNSYQAALAEFAECQKTNKWPGYESKIQILNLPRWALYAEGINPSGRDYEMYE